MAKIAYATKVENSGATAAGRISAADANEIKTSVNALYDKTPYTSLIATISQTGTSAPVVTILQNDTGLTFTPARTGAGYYTLTPNTPPTLAKTWLVGGTNAPFSDKALITFAYQSGVIVIKTVDLGADVNADALLLDTAIEFRIYP